MQHKLLTLCIDTEAGYNRLAECLDSIVIAPSASELEVLVFLSDPDDSVTALVQAYIDRYPDVVRTLSRDAEQTFIQQSATEAKGKYLRPLGSDCIIEPNDLECLVRFLSDCDDDVVIHGCTVTDDCSGAKEGFYAPLGLLGRGTPTENAAPMIHDLPSQSAVVKTQLVKRSGAIGNWRNDYSEFFINGLMQAVTVGGVDADLCRFTAPVSLVHSDADYLEQTIFTLTDLFCVYTSSPDSKTAAINCIAHRIARLAVTRLGLWLSMPYDTRVRDEIYDFFRKLRRANRRVYECFMNDRYARKLRVGKFRYGAVSRAYRKKNNK